MTETTKSVVLLVALFVGLPFLILWSRDRISDALWRRRNPPEKLAADRRSYEERIVRPDWEFYERHLRRPAPSALGELYASRAMVTSQSLYCSDSIGISSFEALDEQGRLDTRPWLGFDAVAIATSDLGDPIYLRPGSGESNKVYIAYHDSGDTEIYAESVADMVARLRYANSAV